jgi:hypothetical protein
MTRKLFSFFAFVLLFQSAIALNCNGLEGGDLYVCNSIYETSLPQNEKDLLIADILNKNKTVPNFDFVSSWNNNLNIASPSNKQYNSSGTINSAWIEIIALMPSILENGTLFTTNQGSLKTEYAYSYNLPSAKLSGDCKTTYYLKSNAATLNVFLNNHNIGSSKSSQFNIQNTGPNLTFKSEVTIQLSYNVERYRTRYYKRYSRCEYWRTETRTDTLKILDSLNAQLYKVEPLSEFEITSRYNNITRGTLQANNFTNLILSFNNSNYRNSKYIYSLNYSLPHYVLTLQAEKVDQTDSSNIFVERQENSYLFNVIDSSDCKIRLSTHFSSTNRNCNMDFNEIEVSIKADKVNYYENSTIRVRTTPENQPINLTYANQTKLVEGYAEFNATLRANKIFTEINGKEIAYFVNVIEREKIDFLIDLSSLSLVGFIFFRFIRAYLGITI